jgi:tripartite-type tricarboxylate transporter receptor subunit TctC
VTVPGCEMVDWTGLLVHAKTPNDVSGAIHKAAVSVLNTPDVQKRLEGLGYIVVSTRPEEMETYLKGEIEKYAQLIRRLDLPLH